MISVALLVLDLRLDVLDGVVALDFERDRLFFCLSQSAGRHVVPGSGAGSGGGAAAAAGASVGPKSACAPSRK